MYSNSFGAKPFLIQSKCKPRYFFSKCVVNLNGNNVKRQLKNKKFYLFEFNSA